MFVARLDAAARLILRDHELARDAVQEGFLRAWRNLPSLRDPDRFEAWLRSLVSRSCIDVLRRRGRRPIEVELLIDRRTGSGRHRVGRRRPRPARAGAPAPRARAACGHRPALLPRDVAARRGGGPRDPDRDRQIPPPSVARADARRDRRRPGCRDARRSLEGSSHDRLRPGRTPPAELIDELAAAGVPDYFDDMLRTTTQARQRPAWSNLERWLPMGVIARPRRPVVCRCGTWLSQLSCC